MLKIIFLSLNFYIVLFLESTVMKSGFRPSYETGFSGPFPFQWPM